MNTADWNKELSYSRVVSIPFFKGWLHGDFEKVQTEYNILARYDLTIADIEDLGWRLTYPPSPELNIRSIWIKP